MNKKVIEVEPSKHIKNKYALKMIKKDLKEKTLSLYANYSSLADCLIIEKKVGQLGFKCKFLVKLFASFQNHVKNY